MFSQLRGRRGIAFGKAGNPPADSDLREEGDRCRDQGRWAEAAVWYRKHLDEYPDDFAIWVQLGNCFKEAELFDQAHSAYWRAIALNGRDADVFLQLGHLKKLMGQPRQAIDAYRTSLARQPHDNPAADELSALGVTAEIGKSATATQVGDGDGAPKGRSLMTVFGQLHGRRRQQGLRSPADSDARREGDRCRDEGRWADAAASYRKHLDEHSDDFAIWVQLGNCLKEASSFDQAHSAYWRAIALHGDDADVFLQLGHLQKLMGRPKEAIEAYRTSLSRQPQGNTAAEELSAFGIAVENRATGPLTRSGNVHRRLRVIENQLSRLTEANVASAQAVPPDRSSGPVIQPSPQISSVAPTPAVIAAKEGQSALLLVVSCTEPLSAKPSGLVADLARALVQHAGPVRFVRWNADFKTFELLAREELDAFELAAQSGNLATRYPPKGSSRIVIDPSSCSKDDWLLFAEPLRANAENGHLTEMDMIIAGRRLGVRSAFIFHGAEPLRLKRHFGHDAEAHEQYMQALLLADVVIPASTLAFNDLHVFFSQHQKATTGPRIEKVVVPLDGRGASTRRWPDYARRIRGLLTNAAEEARSVASLYFVIDPQMLPTPTRQTFARRLARALVDRGIALVPILWDAELKRPIGASAKHLDDWSEVDGPDGWAEWAEPGAAGSPDWILHPDAVRGDLLMQIAAFAKARGLRTAAILGVSAGVTESRSGNFADEAAVFEALTGFDKVLSVSERRFQEFHRFLLSWRGKVHSAEDRFKVVCSANEAQERRRVVPKRPEPGVVRILVILADADTLDLSIMLDAVAEAARRSANRLVFAIVGDCPDPGDPKCAAVRTRIDSIPAARWYQAIDQVQLDKLFEQADYAVFGSIGSNLGRSARESLSRGIPCLVHDEAAPADGDARGLMFADFSNCSQLTEAIVTLAEHDWRRCLAFEAIARPVRSWNDYAKDIAAELATDRLTDGSHPVGVQAGREVYATLINLRRRPKLSLCISTYNRAGWVEVNLRNIFSQIAVPREELEVLVVDNTSLDHTPEVVKPYLARPDFRYMRNPKNVGMLGNLAVTAQRARGEYIWILGDDDLTRPGVIERVLHIIGKHPGLALIYMNYGYTTENNPANAGDVAAFLASFNMLEPAGPDEYAPVKHVAAKCENFFTAIYSHIYRRDHAMKSYCQDTSGRIFSTMLSCVPTAYYVFNYMANEQAYWMGEPSLVVNSNVSWQDFGTLLDLEQLPRTWDLAERMGAIADDVDRRRANRLWLVEMMWKEIFENDRAGNSEFFSASRVLMRLKHLKEIDKHIPNLRAIYEHAHKAGHPAAGLEPGELFSAFRDVPRSSGGPTGVHA